MNHSSCPAGMRMLSMACTVGAAALGSEARAQPANDACANAITVNAGTYTGTTVGATNDYAGECGASNATADVWYVFTPTISGTIQLSMCGSSYDTVLSAYSGLCGALTNLACNDDSCGLQSMISWGGVAGTTYHIRVSGFAGQTGTYTLNVQGGGPPGNNACANATTVAAGTTPFTTLGATTDGPADCGGNLDVWFRYTAATNGAVTMSTCGGQSFDTVLSAYQGFSCPPGALIACNDNTCGLQSQIAFTAVAGQQILIRVGGAGAASGTGNLTITPPPGNDACANAAPITNGLTPFTTLGATTDGPGDCPVGQDIWFVYTANATGNVTVSTCAGATFDTALSVYSGFSCPPGARLACNDNTCGLQSQVSFSGVQGQMYLIRVGGSGMSSGTGTLTVTGPGSGGVGPDVVLSESTDLTNWGVVNGIHGYSLASSTCNIGSQNLNWGFSHNGTPAVAMNAYRLYQGKLIQLGQGFPKFSCCAGASNGCGTSCNGVGGSQLGVGCQDTYGSGYNGSFGVLGPRSSINPFTGAMTGPTGTSGNAIFKRLQVAEVDMNNVNFPGALYFVEGEYIGTDDAQAGNGYNNATYKRVTVNGSYDLVPAGGAQMGIPAIRAWHDHGLGLNTPDPSVIVTTADVPGEGRFHAAGKATDLGSGRWRYDFAVFNLNSDQSGGAFTVHVPATAQVTNVSFHSAPSHSGEPYDNTNWTNTTDSGTVTWSSPQTFAQNPNSNALRWGTMYNFSFDVNSRPIIGEATLGLFKPGPQGSIQIVGIPVPAVPACPADLNGDGILNVRDFLAFLQLFSTGDPLADFNGDGSVNVVDFGAYLNAFGQGC
jgi:hypothetical protein